MEHHLSWDCANRTISCVTAEIAADFVERAKNISPDTDLTQYLIDNLVVTCAQVDDVLCKKLVDCDIPARAKLLKNYLTSPKVAAFTPDHVVIEAQPPRVGHASNIASTGVAFQLAYQYSDKPISMADPKIKKNLVAGGHIYADYLKAEMDKIPENLPGEKLRSRKQAARYRANKKHATAIFRYAVGDANILADIPKRLHNHAADAYCNLLCVLMRRVAAKNV